MVFVIACYALRFALFSLLPCPFGPRTADMRHRGHEAIHPSTWSSWSSWFTAEVCIVSVKHHPQKVLLRSLHPCSRGQFPSRVRANPKYPPPHREIAPKVECLDQDLFLLPKTAIGAVLIAVEQAAHTTCCFSAPHYEYESSLEELT